MKINFTIATEKDIPAVHFEVEQHNEGGTKLYREKGYDDNGRILLSKKINHKL